MKRFCFLYLSIVALSPLLACTPQTNFVTITDYQYSTIPVTTVPQITTDPQPTAAISGSRLIATFTGNANKVTQLFIVTKKNWYIDYTVSYNPDLPVIFFIATVLPSTEDAYSSNWVTVINATSPGTDISYIYNKSGTFFFTVAAACNWTLKVYE